jgi:hypothetical protein
VNQQIKYFTDMDMNVQVVQMSPLAVYNAMYNDNRLNGTTMVIDLGAENTDLIICDNETIWLRSIPIGGNNFTDALVKAFKLNFAKAEDLKRNAATSKYARQIFQAMRPIFADLVAEIQRSVGFYASVHRDSRIKKVLALGGTFKLPGLQKYLQQNLQLDVERLDTITAAPSAESKLAPNFNENILSIVSAYGLAIQAMGQSKITSSLLPAKIRREKMWKQKTPLFGAAAALFAAGLGVGVATWWLNDMAFHGGTAQAAYSKVEDVERQAKELDASWSDIEGATAPARQKIINIQSLLDYRSLWPKLMSEVQSSLPQAGKPQFASLDPAEIKKTPRGQRQIVLIDSITSEYRPDLKPLMDAEDIRAYGVEGANAGMATPAAPTDASGAPAAPDTTGASPHGFILRIHCTTPYAAGGDLIQKQFIPALLNIKPNAADKDKKYAIVKAQIVQPLHVGEDQTRVANLRTAYHTALEAMNSQNNITLNISGGGGSYPGMGEGGDMIGGPRQIGGLPNLGGGGAAAQPGTPEDTMAFQDRATGESVLDDWEATVVALVQIDPPPPAPPAQQANAQQP